MRNTTSRIRNFFISFLESGSTKKYYLTNFTDIAQIPQVAYILHISCGDLSYCAGRFHNIYILVLDGQDSQLLCRFHFYPKEKLVTCHSSKFHLIKNILFNGYARFFLFLLKKHFSQACFHSLKQKSTLFMNDSRKFKSITSTSFLANGVPIHVHTSDFFCQIQIRF